MDTSTVIAPETAQDLEDAIAHVVRQIDELREQMRASDVSIRQSDAEYTLLKAESQALREQTERILANAWSLL